MPRYRIFGDTVDFVASMNQSGEGSFSSPFFSAVLLNINYYFSNQGADKPGDKNSSGYNWRLQD